MPRTAHLAPVLHDQVPMTVPIPRYKGMDWPGDEEWAQVPVTLLLAARGRCSCDSCSAAFVELYRRTRVRAV